MDHNEKLQVEQDERARSLSGATVGVEPEQKLHIDRKEENKLLLKLDAHIAPVVMILYLIAFLDRYFADFADFDSQIEHRICECPRTEHGYRSHRDPIQCRNKYILRDLRSHRDARLDSRQKSQIQSNDPADRHRMGNSVLVHRLHSELCGTVGDATSSWCLGRRLISVVDVVLDDLV